MLRIGWKRLWEILPTVIGISFFAFILIRIAPGDPVLLMVGERGADPQQYAQMQAQLGLDQPLYRQYGAFVGSALQGDMGTSVSSHRPVTEEFMARWPATLELGAAAFLLAIVIGVPMGIIAALRRNSALDYAFTGASLIGYSMPIFWWALILILLFSVHLDWTPVSGRIAVSFEVAPWSGFLLIDTLRPEVVQQYGHAAFKSAAAHLVLPSVVMATVPLAVFARMTRSSMLEVLRLDYVRTARAKGLRERTVVNRHVLANSLIPVITVIGIVAGVLLGGAIAIETVFTLPGVGRLVISAVKRRDYPLIQGVILFITFSYLIVNLVVDLLYVFIDPRVRYS